MPQHRTGPGIAGKHTTAIDSALPIIDALIKVPKLRMTLGKIIKTSTNGNRTLKISNTKSGFLMKVVGNCYAQTFFVIVPKENIDYIKNIAYQAFI